MFRQLCREAVIFMLLGLVVAAIGSFVYLHHAEATSIQEQRDALRKNCDSLARGPAGATVIERDGIVLVTVAECELVFGTDPAHGGYIDLSAGLVSKPTLTPAPDFIPSFLDQQQDMLKEGARIKNLKIDNPSNAFSAVIMGLYGFAGGLGVWLFYRLVRFAVKG